MALGTTTANSVFNALFRATNYTAPTAIYLALFTSDPTAAGSGTEVSGGSYARQNITGLFNAPSSGSQSNNAQISFPVATANWGTVTHVAIYDAASAGTLISFGALTASQVVNTNNQFVINTGQLTETLS